MYKLLLRVRRLSEGRPDKSLEPKFVKCLGTGLLRNFGAKYEARCYPTYPAAEAKVRGPLSEPYQASLHYARIPEFSRFAFLPAYPYNVSVKSQVEERSDYHS